MFHEFATVKMFLQLYETEKVVDKHVRFNRIHLKKKKKTKFLVSFQACELQKKKKILIIAAECV